MLGEAPEGADHDAIQLRVPRLLPEIKDYTKGIPDIAILASAPPANDLAPIFQQFIARGFEILDEQLHHQAADFVILNDKQVERIRIMVTEGRIT